MRVLVASNDLTFIPSLVFAYKAQGHDVTVGLSSFSLQLGQFDVVHLHWPEELVGFGRNCAHPGKTAAALKVLDWWAKRAVIVTTVHNLVPHAAERIDGPEARYFEAFYGRADLICHFSEYSRLRYGEVYPSLNSSLHMVHGLNDFDHLRPLSVGRSVARQALELDETRSVFSVVGTIRKAEEMHLLRNGWSAVKPNESTLLLAIDPPWSQMRLIPRRLDKMSHRRWVKRGDVVNLGGGIDDGMLVRILEASDALIIPRFGEHLNSGLLPLALTFGTPLVAPDYGVYRELLKNTMNALYSPGDARSLGGSLRRLLGGDFGQLRRQNLELREQLGWPRILKQMQCYLDEMIRKKTQALVT